MDLPPLSRLHLRRLREIYRSAGWPCHDMIEVALLAAGLVERQASGPGLETLRVTDAGIRQLALGFARNQAARTPHEDLVAQVAQAQVRAGRLAWRGLMLRVQVPAAMLPGAPTSAVAAALPGGMPLPLPLSEPVPGSMPDSRPDLNPGSLPALDRPDPSLPWPTQGLDAAHTTPGDTQAWCMASPDVFSIRHSSVEAYLEPVVHEIKVSRADLLGDIKKPAKRAAYLGLASACWYVLGMDARGRPIGGPEDVPPTCGVMLATPQGLEVAREAPRRAVQRLPFHVWMALAKAGGALREDEPAQAGF